MAGGENRQILLKQRPKGLPGPECYELRRSPIPKVGEGEILIRNFYLSLDPAIRGWMSDAPSYMPPIPVGTVMRGTTVGRIVESRSPQFKVGDIVHGLNGWEDYTLAQASPFTMPVPMELHRPLTNFLSVLGPTGLTAYFAMIDVCKPKAGETVLVSGAAGAVGSVAGQIAKIKGCRIVGIAGGAAKCESVRRDFGFDAAIDYRAAKDLIAAINAACPKGVDIYFDNVGGEILNATLMTINQRARILMCGQIATYNSTEPAPGPSNLWQLLVKTARLEGFLVSSYLDRWPEGRKQLAEWLNAGLIKFKEHIDQGLENAPESMLRLFSGKHDGKLIVDIAGSEAA